LGIEITATRALDFREFTLGKGSLKAREEIHKYAEYLVDCPLYYDHDAIKALVMALAKKVAKGHVKPRLYQCCGTEDFIYKDNIRFRDAVRKLPLDLTYEEGPGEHNWAYRDKMIQNVLAWMFPRGKKS
jgi:hypothetical protein